MSSFHIYSSLLSGFLSRLWIVLEYKATAAFSFFELDDSPVDIGHREDIDPRMYLLFNSKVQHLVDLL